MPNYNSYSRRYVKIGLIVSFSLLLIHVCVSISNFIHIFSAHAGVALTQEQVLQAYDALDGSNAGPQPVVPRILHQIFHNWTHPDEEVLPLDWQATRQTCLALNEGWEHVLWTSRTSRAFLELEYPWFLPTYDHFRHPVQRIDALRYFLMRHYGGIYVDLDNGCDHNLEALRYHAAWTTDGGHGALSNNILGAVPEHPFWVMLTDEIISHAWKYPLPFITVSYATGQWFLTKIWEEYHHGLSRQDAVLTRVMMDGRPEGARWVFFNHSRGGTWDDWDKEIFEWVGRNLLPFSLLATAAMVVVIGATLSIWRRVKVSGVRHE